MPPDKKDRKPKPTPDRFLEMDEIVPDDKPKNTRPAPAKSPSRSSSRRNNITPPAEVESAPGVLSHWIDQLWYPASQPWKPVSKTVFWSLSALLGFLLYSIFTDPTLMSRGILRLVHQINLVFHEFGHPFFGLLGNRTLAILGGTLGQLMVPLIVLIAFWRQREAAGFAFGMFWFFENFLDIAVYMADAKYLRLQLIGGLGMEAHDWRNLFLHWDVILHATTIAGVTRALGWVGMIWAWVWFGWRRLSTNDSDLRKW